MSMTSDIVSPSEIASKYGMEWMHPKAFPEFVTSQLSPADYAEHVRNGRDIRGFTVDNGAQQVVYNENDDHIQFIRHRHCESYGVVIQGWCKLVYFFPQEDGTEIKVTHHYDVGQTYHVPHWIWHYAVQSENYKDVVIFEATRVSGGVSETWSGPYPAEHPDSVDYSPEADTKEVELPSEITSKYGMDWMHPKAFPEFVTNKLPAADYAEHVRNGRDIRGFTADNGTQQVVYNENDDHIQFIRHRHCESYGVVIQGWCKLVYFFPQEDGTEIKVTHHYDVGQTYHVPHWIWHYAVQSENYKDVVIFERTRVSGGVSETWSGPYPVEHPDSVDYSPEPEDVDEMPMPRSQAFSFTSKSLPDDMATSKGMELWCLVKNRLRTADKVPLSPVLEDGEDYDDDYDLACSHASAA